MMIRLMAFCACILLLPPIAHADPDEIERLKREIQELREQNARYVERINRIETRLLAIESETPGEAKPQAPSESDSGALAEQEAPPVVASAAREADAPEVDQPTTPALDTGFDPARFDYFGYLRAGYGVTEDGTSQDRFVLILSGDHSRGAK